MIKVIYKVLIFICAFVIFSISCFAYSFDEAFEDYQKSFEDTSSLDEIQNNGFNNVERMTKDVSELYEIPNLTYEEWLIYKDRDKKRIDEVVKAVSEPSLAFLDTMGVVPFASDSRGASCDKRVAYYDFYRKMYYVIEYNSYYGEILLTPDYNETDGYYFWLSFRLYYDSSSSQVVFRRIGSSWYGDSITPDLGYTSTGDRLFVFYVYSFKYPTDYNSSSEVSFGDAYGTMKTGQDTTVTNHTKVGQYFYQSRFRIMPIYVDKSNSSTSTVIVGHSTCPCAAGLFLYTDDTLRVTQFTTGAIINQTIEHSGKVVGNVGVNYQNVYRDYQSYIVNGYNYWLFANFLNNYSVEGNTTDYGFFQPLYDVVFNRLDYISSYIIPQATLKITDVVETYAANFNSLVGLVITSPTTSVFWVFTIALGLVIFVLTWRVLIYLSRW